VETFFSKGILKNEKEYVEHTIFDCNKYKQINKNFFYKQDTATNMIRYYCLQCIKYGKVRTAKSTSLSNDWVNRGMPGTVAKFRLVASMKRHLDSIDHKNSVEVERLKKIKNVNITLPSNLEKNTATENLCTGVQLMAAYNLPYRFWPLFCTTLNIMAKNSEGRETKSFVGNNNQSHNVVPHAQYACYEACMEKMQTELRKVFLATGQPLRFHLCADKGTAQKDCTRQAIVETHIGFDGYPHESLVSVDGINDATANGASLHFTKYVSSILKTSQIVAISTDGASTYTGRHKGMFQVLKSDHENYSDKLLYLPDLCHRTERLLDNNSPAWLEEAIETNDKLISRINSSPLLREAMLKHVNIETGVKLFAMQTTCETRYAEYLHRSLQSVLKNVEIMHLAFPEIIQSNEYDQKTRLRCESLFSTISDPCFIAKLLLADNVFAHVQCMEKEAQGACFGSFDYVKSISNFKFALETTLRKADKNALNVIQSGLFKHEFLTNGKKHSFTVDLNCSKNETTKTCESLEELQLKEDIVKKSYESWLDELLNDFSNYIEIPTVVDLATKTFTLSEKKPLSDRVQHLRTFLSMVNTEFMTCGEMCTGLDSCNCVTQQLQSFMQNVEMQLTVQHADPWTCDISVKGQRDKVQYNYSTIFAHYLADNNDKLRDELKIINILRALEVVQLLKASQSATERAFSIVGRVVQGRYENRYRLNKTRQKDEICETQTDSRDYVASAVFIAMNSNIVNLDAALARQKFLAAGHEYALLSSKPTNYTGKAVKTVLERLLKHPFTNKKRTVDPVRKKQLGTKRAKLIINTMTDLFDDKIDSSASVININPVVENITTESIDAEVESRTAETDVKILTSNIDPVLEYISTSCLDPGEKNITDEIDLNIPKSSSDRVAESMETSSINPAEEIIKLKIQTDQSADQSSAKQFSWPRPSLNIFQKFAKDKKDKASWAKTMGKLRAFKFVERDDSSPKKNTTNNTPTTNRLSVNLAERQRPVLMLRDGRILNVQDKLSLVQDNQWLEQNIVTGFLACFMENDIVILGDNDWNLISDGQEPQSKIFEWKGVKQVLVGRHEPYHFVLYYFDMVARKFYYLNTLALEEEIRFQKATSVLNIWNLFNEKQVVKSALAKKFSLGMANHPIQVDGNSCGVLVCKMGQCIATGELLASLKSDERSISRYRQQIWQVLFENRDTELCCSCRNVKDNANVTNVNDKWIECSKCNLWYHLSCAKISYLLTKKEIEELNWKCPYCNDYFNQL